MTVHFIGAGPGAADLITVRGRDLMAACPVCLYAGSLIPRELLAHCPPGARIVNTASMSLDDIVAEIQAAEARGEDVARLHSGDLSVWSAMGEQLRRLREAGIAYTVTPGVPSFAAAAATLGAELTLPGLCQSVVLTRTSGRATCPRVRTWPPSRPRAPCWPSICPSMWPPRCSPSCCRTTAPTAPWPSSGVPAGLTKPWCAPRWAAWPRPWPPTWSARP